MISRGATYAPLLLGLAGPAGLAAGVLGHHLLMARRGDQRREQMGADLLSSIQQAGGGDDMADLPALLKAQAGLEAKYPGMQFRSLGDLIAFHQSALESQRGQQDRVDLQNMANQQALQRGDIENQRGLARDEAQSADAWARTMWGAEQDMARQRDSQAFQREQAQAQARAAGGLGNVQAGYSRYYTDAGEVVDLPNEGTRDYNEAMRPVDQTSRTLAALQELRDDLASAGTETFGAGSKRQAILYSRALRALGDLSEAGVLQSGELEMMQNQLPDPTTLGSGLNPWGASNATAAFDTLASEVLRRGLDAWRRSPAGIKGGAIPEAWANEQRRAARQSASPSGLPPGWEPVGDGGGVFAGSGRVRR